MILRGRNTTLNDFENVKDIITNKYPSIFNRDNINGIYVKRLPDADVLPQNKSAISKGNTTHIACTSDSINFFYRILGDIAFNQGLTRIETFPIYVETQNIQNNSNNTFVNSECTIWKIPKKNGDQLGLSKQEYDGQDFFKLRQEMYTGDMVIFFKYKNPNNILENYIILLNHSDPYDIQFINHIIGPIRPTSFTKYYELG